MKITIYTNPNTKEFPDEYPIGKRLGSEYAQLTSEEFRQELVNHSLKGTPYCIKNHLGRRLRKNDLRNLKVHLKISGRLKEKNGFRDMTLLEDFWFYTADGDLIVIPKGYKCDGASAPILRQRAIIAAVVHDFLYVSGFLTRKEADLLFYYYMVNADHSPEWLAYTFYLAVRGFGKRHYNLVV